MSPNRYNNLISCLIAVGKVEDFVNLPILVSLSEQSTHPLLADSHDQWLATVNSLAPEEILALIKSLTIGEQMFQSWSAGSVSPVIRLFWRLYDIKPAQADMIAEWVLANTKNPYLPFGSMFSGGAKTGAEFRRYLAESYWRAEENVLAERERQRMAKNSKGIREAELATQNLFNAVRRGDEKAVEALLNKGARIDDANKDGMSILALAEERGNERIIELIRNVSADSLIDE
jgi:hypothetical protein